jgi:hypothetical protein
VEIGLCPHSRIYPRTKLATPLGLRFILEQNLRIRLLERHFDYIEYQHISRNLNTLTDALANYVLDRHLNNL